MNSKINETELLAEIQTTKAHLEKLKAKLSNYRRMKRIEIGESMPLKPKKAGSVNRALNYLVDAIRKEQNIVPEGAVTTDWIVEALNSWIESPFQPIKKTLPSSLSMALNHDPRFGKFQDNQGNRAFYYVKV